MEIDPSMAYSPLYKVILVGESNVGKTSFLSMYVKGVCNQTIPTIAVEFCTKEFKVFDGSLVKVQLWDTAGQERFKSMAMNYYRKAFGILLMFDVTKQSSFDACVQYIEDIRNTTDSECIVYLIGNKIDLADQRVITKEDAKRFARKNSLKYYEASAVQNQGVNETFEKLINEIHSIKKKSFEEEIRKEEEKIVVSRGNNSQLKKSSVIQSDDGIKCCA